MSAAMVLDQLYTLGLTVRVQGDLLTVQPKERLTDELREAIRNHKSDIIQLLSPNQIASKGTKREDRRNRPENREGPPYPDGLGNVKCMYCARLEIQGPRAACCVDGSPLAGIALLRECGRFVMRTIH